MLKLFSSLVLFAGLSFAQATVSVPCPTNVNVGSPLICQINLTGGTNPAGIQFSYSVPANVASVTATLAPSLAATKSLQCANGICIIVGVFPATLNSSVIADGQIATLTYQTAKGAKGTFPAGIGSCFTVDANGNPIGCVVNPTSSISINPSKCDINGDGQIDGVDVALILSEALKNTPQVHDLSGDGAVTVVDVQIVIAGVSGACNAK